jgi:hypothetical protein
VQDLLFEVPAKSLSLTAIAAVMYFSSSRNKSESFCSGNS